MTLLVERAPPCEGSRTGCSLGAELPHEERKRMNAKAAAVKADFMSVVRFENFLNYQSIVHEYPYGVFRTLFGDERVVKYRSGVEK